MKARGEDGLAYMIGGNAVGRRKLNQEEDHGGPPVAGSVCGESHRTHNRARQGLITLRHMLGYILVKIIKLSQYFINEHILTFGKYSSYHWFKHLCL